MEEEEEEEEGGGGARGGRWTGVLTDELRMAQNPRPAGGGPGANCPSRLAACSNMPVETCDGSTRDQRNARRYRLPKHHSGPSDGASQALNLMRGN